MFCIVNDNKLIIPDIYFYATVNDKDSVNISIEEVGFKLIKIIKLELKELER